LGVVINYQRNQLETSLSLPAYVNLIGGLAIVSGLATYGRKVMTTVGGGITPLSFSKAFCAQAGASISILTATVLGLPISTTAVLVGCITGVGLTEGWRSDAVDFRLIGRIVLAWIITLPAAAITSGLIFLMFRNAW
jgi:PiT family inorganic phosphate transporter